MTNACTRVVVPNSSRMMVTVHSAMNPRCGLGLAVFGRLPRLGVLHDYVLFILIHRYSF